MITSVCRMRRICLGFHGKNWQKSQGAKKLEDFWIPPSAIIKGGSQERVFQLFLNAQNVYYILDDGDEQEKDTVSLEIKEYISRQEAAELAGVSVSTVTKWMQSGEFQCAGAGKVLRVHRQQFLNWLNEHREGVV